MSKTDNPTRCVECSCMICSSRLQYYPVLYCKINGREINFNAREGWDKMKWCPLEQEETKDA